MEKPVGAPSQDRTRLDFAKLSPIRRLSDYPTATSPSSNYSSSVEPASAVIEDLPPAITCVMSSKYPAPSPETSAVPWPRRMARRKYGAGSSLQPTSWPFRCSRCRSPTKGGPLGTFLGRAQPVRRGTGGALCFNLIDFPCGFFLFSPKGSSSG